MKLEINDRYMSRKQKHGSQAFMGYTGELSRTEPDYMCFREDGSYTGYDKGISLNWRVNRIGILIGKEPIKT